MAFWNIRTGWKKTLIVMLSIAISLATLNITVYLVNRNDFSIYQELFLAADFQIDKLSSLRDFSDFHAVSPEMQESISACPYSRDTGYVYYSDERLSMPKHLKDTYTRIEEKYAEIWGYDWDAVWEEIAASNQIPVLYLGITESIFDKLEWRNEAASYEDFQRGDYVIVDYPDTYYSDASLISVTVLVPASEYIACTGNKSAMRAVINALPGQEKKLQSYLKDTVLKEDRTLSFTSILDVKKNFDRYVSKYYIIGSCLSFVLAFIGIMNFYNTTAASLLSRKKELALLEAVGMTKKQLWRMLAAEGLFSLGGTFVLAFLFTFGYLWRLVRNPAVLSLSFPAWLSFHSSS